MSSPDDGAKWRGYLSPLSIGLMVVNGICFGGSLVLLAVGKGSVLLAIGSGLMQYPMPFLARIVFIIPFLFLAFWVVMEFFEKRYDGYRAVHGYGKEHPYNKEREFL